MSLVLEKEIHFDPATDQAIIWGDADSKRFRLVITRKLLVDKYGLKAQFDHTGAEKIIREHWAVFERVAQAAHDAGSAEVFIK